MLKLDEWILKRIFTPAGQSICRWTGIEPPRLAHICFGITMVSSIMVAYLKWKAHYALWQMVLEGGAMMFPVYMVLGQYDMFKLWNGRMGIFLRLAFLGSLLLGAMLSTFRGWSTIAVIDTIGFVSAIIGMYLIMVPPPPPEFKRQLATQGAN